MPIAGSRYIPETHTGTKEEIIQGLIAEAEEIAECGYMRMHAQDRELRRIQAHLGMLGVDLLFGTGAEHGKILIVMEHLPGCQIETTRQCECPVAKSFVNPL
jgi:hypothetical protein